MKKVLIIIPTDDVVEKECLDAAHAQDYTNCTVTVSIVEHPAIKFQIQTSICSTINRNKARIAALASDADLFMYLDSDVVLPINAVASLAAQLETAGREIIGGWYKMTRGNLWVAGRFDADKTFSNFTAPEPGVVSVDMVGLGCVLMTRKVLADVEFGNGLGLSIKRTGGKETWAGPSMKFSADAAAKGYGLFMNGDVVAQHLTRAVKPATL
jgi:hypothetical protein